MSKSAQYDTPCLLSVDCWVFNITTCCDSNRDFKGLTVTTVLCTHCHQGEGHVDGPDAQSQVFGLIELGLEHSGGVINDLEEKGAEKRAAVRGPATPRYNAAGDVL